MVSLHAKFHNHPLTQSHKAQLHRSCQLFLRFPAKSALKCLQVLCLGATVREIMLSQRDLGPDGITILRISLAVYQGCYRSEDMELLHNNRLLDEHIERLMEMLELLDDDIVLKLALLTWYFDASSQTPYEELLRFFPRPDEECSEIYMRICESYSIYTGSCVSQEEFKQGFLELVGFLRYVLQDVWSVI